MIVGVDAKACLLQVRERSIPCSIGRGGTIAAREKREGDGATPRGEWPIRGVLARPDRVARIETALPWRWLRRDDGWSDDPADPDYNRPVRHPHRYSAERMWRDDGLYDVVVVLGHNDAPAIAGFGSAIFLHCWRDAATTEGCVAVARDELLAIVATLRPGDALSVR